MIQKRFVSLLLCAALALCLLAGCDTAASGSTRLRFRPGQQLGQRVQREHPQHHQRGQHLRPAPEF